MIQAKNINFVHYLRGKKILESQYQNVFFFFSNAKHKAKINLQKIFITNTGKIVERSSAGCPFSNVTLIIVHVSKLNSYWETHIT